MKRLWMGVFVALCFINSKPSIASEKLGELELSAVLFEPKIRLVEENTVSSGLELGHSYLGISWTRGPRTSLHLRMGSKSLINRPSWTTWDEDFGFFESFGQFQSGYGQLRAGLIPIGFGYEGRMDEAELLFPRSFFFEKRFMPLRDLGVSYSVNHNGFYTTAVIHNGEAGTDRDRRLFHTANWGWFGPAGIHLGFSGSTGRWIASSKSEETFQRLGNAFFAFDVFGIGLVMEGILGEQKSSTSQEQFLNWHADFQHAITRKTGVQLRYEFFDPNVGGAGGEQKKISLGFSLHGEFKTSSFYFIATKLIEDQDMANDEFLVVWRLTSIFDETYK